MHSNNGKFPFSLFAGEEGLNLFDGIGESKDDNTFAGVYVCITGWYLHDAFTHNGTPE